MTRSPVRSTSLGETAEWVLDLATPKRSTLAAERELKARKCRRQLARLGMPVTPDAPDYLRALISASPLSASFTLQRCAGDSVMMISSVGLT